MCLIPQNPGEDRVGRISAKRASAEGMNRDKVFELLADAGSALIRPTGNVFWVWGKRMRKEKRPGDFSPGL
jgi:hypothetical protein